VGTICFIVLLHKTHRFAILTIVSLIVLRYLTPDTGPLTRLRSTNSPHLLSSPSSCSRIAPPICQKTALPARLHSKSIDILPASYPKLAMLFGLSPHPCVSHLFHMYPAQMRGSGALSTRWRLAAGCSVFNSSPPRWTLALGELVLRVDSKFKVRKSIVTYVSYGSRAMTHGAAWGLSPSFFSYWIEELFSAPKGSSTCSYGTVSMNRLIHSCPMLVGGVMVGRWEHLTKQGL
jgi:hypothetical protein